MVPVTWREFSEVAPDLAAFARERLVARVSYLATVDTRGVPRVHPVTVHEAEGHLFVYMEPTSPKADDLRRRDCFALHCSVEDRSGGLGEVAVRGRAYPIEERELRARLFASARQGGFDPQERYVVFDLKIGSVLSTVYENGQPMRRRWRAG